MTTVVLDTNTIWRKKPFMALAELRDVILMEPADPRVAMRSGSWFPRKGSSTTHDVIPVLMPLGWASRLNKFACRRLMKVAAKVACRRDSTITNVIVTSPHYHPMIAICEQLDLPLFYYGSDDYALYDHWGGQSILDHEAEIVRAAQHSFFVSQPLCDRLIDQYGVDRDRVSVSPNATSNHFLQPQSDAKIAELRRSISGIKSPVVGVVGAINERLDFDLLRQVLEIDSLGTLLFVGQTSPNWQHAGWSAIKGHEKCIHVGRQPHESLPVWMQMLDVALIPYADTEFNRSCSPMRLYDHLASGKPIVCTASCPQCHLSDKFATVTNSHDRFIASVENMIGKTVSLRTDRQREYTSRYHTWRIRASDISQKISQG